MKKGEKYVQPGYNEFGEELPDPTPMELPLGANMPMSIEARIRRALRHEISEQAQAAGMESWDEANDFDCGDEDGDEGHQSPHELTDDQEMRFRADKENAELAERYRRLERARQRQATPPATPPGKSPQSDPSASGDVSAGRQQVPGSGPASKPTVP